LHVIPDYIDYDGNILYNNVHLLTILIYAYAYQDKCDKMKRDHTKIKAKLYELGKTVGLETSEIDKAKRTTRTIVSICIVAGIFALIGIFTSRLDAVGLWYVGVSIKDFGLLSNFL